MMPRPCNICGLIPLCERFGKNYDVWCPQKDTNKYPYPPCVTAKDKETAIKKWNKQFGGIK